MDLFRGFVLVCGLVVSVTAVEKRYTDRNLMQCMTDMGLTDLVQLLTETNMNSALSNTGSSYTVMAPTNAAFSKVDVNLMGTLAHEPILKKQILQYHVIPGFNVLPQLLQQHKADTLEGQPMRFTGFGGNVLINNSTRPVPGNSSDVICRNGVVHVIDSVLTPPVFGTHNIAANLVLRDDLFQDMFLALLLNNLTHILEDTEFTLFAPTNLAFGRYSALNGIRPNMPNAQMIYHEVFKYHMVPGRRTSYNLHDGDKLFTLHNSQINITVDATGMMVDHAKVVEKDIAASNGVIHAIDHIIFPTDLLQNLING
ncbi:POSTN-like protein [Mya arenaria]|uniref:POSTN-like protein n=1 Tax=Mya arenaria TaxID=6604 RepID=A0ABY7DKK4_MYAAR|nr:transforming growth factor-beta-induced protein ig-h3-like [Mya arenaria]XP_052795934.1 transforming growth factor-beta-induced protein ig-h3-like [Mya arenaria]WAQ98219.1 POSTN-like protein [Mya arenaria]